MDVTVIQTGPMGLSVAENAESLADALRQAAVTQSPDLVVFPELALVPYFATAPYEAAFDALPQTLDSPAVMTVRDAARSTETACILGLLERDSDGRCYNSAVLIDRAGTVQLGRMHDGAEVPAYRKLAVPHVSMPTLRVDETPLVSPGPGPMVFELDDVTIGMFICYDRAFSEIWLANRALGADVIVGCVSSTGWREEVWITDLRLRAMEIGSFVIAANRAGDETVGSVTTSYFGRSCVIGPDGTVLAEAPAHQPGCTISAHLDLSQIASARRSWPVWDDRRPELFRDLLR